MRTYRTGSLLLCLLLAACNAAPDGDPAQSQSSYDVGASFLLPTGVHVTPLAAPGSTFDTLHPDLPDFPDFIAGEAVSTALSPDGATMLVLTSGYNRNNGADGRGV